MLIIEMNLNGVYMQSWKIKLRNTVAGNTNEREERKLKLIKVAVIGIIIILLLNSYGMLSKKNTIKVDEAVETVKTKINEMEYKDKPITDMTLKELSSNISTDITYLREDVLTEEGLVLSGKGLKTTINPTKDKILVAEVDSSEPEAIASIEKLLFNLTNQEMKIPPSVLEKDQFIVTVERIDGEHDISYE